MAEVVLLRQNIISKYIGVNGGSEFLVMCYESDLFSWKNMPILRKMRFILRKFELRSRDTMHLKSFFTRNILVRSSL